MDELSASVRHELREQAAKITAAGDLGERARAQAWGRLRRRNALAVGVPLVAVVLLGTFVGPSLLGDSSVETSHHSAPTTPETRPPTATATPTATAGVVSAEQPALAVARGDTVTWNGRTVRLPTWWAVLNITQTSQYLLLDVVHTDERFVATVSVDGTVGRLDSVTPPFAVDQQGTAIAGNAAASPGSVVLVDLATERELSRLEAPSGSVVSQFVGPGTSRVLLGSDVGPPRIWAPAEGTLSLLRLPLNRDRLPVAIDAAGDTWFTVDEQGFLSAERQDAVQPQWTSTRAVSITGTTSPDGSRIAVLEGTELVVLDTSSGALVSRTTLSASPTFFSLTWESDRRILAAARGATTVTFLRCDAYGSGCSSIAAPAGTYATAEVVVAQPIGRR